jgi:uncharacterized protein YndB with AHSA1/START domain
VPHMLDAVLETDNGRTVLRFERTVPHPPERVWRALTTAPELRRWHPTPFTLEEKVGGAVHYEGDGLAAGTVTAFDPPHVLAYTWGDDLLRWELSGEDAGTHLVLLHTFDDRLKSARDAAGWHLCLDALAWSLDGVDRPAPVGETSTEFGWRELNAGYEQRFGIDPDEATRPPAST